MSTTPWIIAFTVAAITTLSLAIILAYPQPSVPAQYLTTVPADTNILDQPTEATARAPFDTVLTALASLNPDAMLADPVLQEKCQQPSQMDQNAVVVAAERAVGSTVRILEVGTGTSTVHGPTHLQAALKKPVEWLGFETYEPWAASINKIWEDAPVPEVSVAVMHVDVGMTSPHKGWPAEPGRTAHILRWTNILKGMTAAARNGYAPDVVIVDGRFRVAVACLAAVMWPQCVIVWDDYTGRKYYHHVEHAALVKQDTVGRVALFRLGDAEAAQQLVSNHMFDRR